MERPLPEQPGAVLLGMVAAALLVAQQVAGKATRDALFLSHYPAAALPQVMMAASLAAVGAALGAGRLVAARGPRQAVPALVGLNAALLLGYFLLAVAAPPVAAVLLYLHVAAAGGMLVSGYWSMVNERFDPWIAKRVVGRLGLGGSLGGVAGGLLAWSVAGAISIPAMLLGIAALNVAALVALVQFGGDAPGTGGRAGSADTSPLSALRAAPYLRTLALVVALGAVTEALLDYVLKSQAAAALARGPELMAFFAAFHAGTGLLSLAAQTLLTRPALQALGLAGTVALRPLAVAAASVAGVVDPRLWSAVLGRGGHDVLTNSLFRSGYELLYTPLPEREKRAAKQVVDVGFDKLGALLGGAAVFGAVSVAAAPERGLLLLACGLSLLLLGFRGRLHRGYVSALEESLRAGKVRLDKEDVVDSTTRLTLAETQLSLGLAARPQQAVSPGAGAAEAGGTAQKQAPADPLLQRIADLRSGDATRVRRAIRGPHAPDTAVVPHLVPLLARNDLYLEVLRALRRLAPRATGQILDALLDPEADPTLRRRLPRVLKACPTQRAVDGLLLGLDDASFEVKAQCAQALAALTTRDPELRVPSQAVFAAARRELEREPAAGADASGVSSAALLEHVFALLSLVLEREPLQISAWALSGGDAALKGTALEYLENVLPPDVRAALLAYVGAAQPARRPRPRREVLEELLRSGEGLSVARDTIRRRSLRPRG